MYNEKNQSEEEIKSQIEAHLQIADPERDRDQRVRESELLEREREREEKPRRDLDREWDGSENVRLFEEKWS